MKKQFAVIGMGRFGSSVAKTLTQMGFEVLAVDNSEARTQENLPFVTQAVQADSTDEDALKALGIRNFEVVVVAIGQDIQASILTTLILKELGVANLVVKAQTELHGKVLKKIGADKVIFPERDMGMRVAHHLISPNIMDYIELSDNYSIVEIKASRRMIGKSLSELHIRAKYHCNVIAIRSPESMNITPMASDVIQADDILIVVGDNNRLQAFELAFKE